MGSAAASAATALAALPVPPRTGPARRDLGAHRDLPVDPDPEPPDPEPPDPEPDTAPERQQVTDPPGSAYGAADAAAAWDRRRRDLQHLAGIIDVLTDVERRADELNRRAAELADEWL